MGDHRAAVELEFAMHGHRAHVYMNINWNGDSGEGCDRRVIEWFEEQAAIAMDRWAIQEAERERQERSAETERREREELARLKAKYEGPGRNDGGTGR